MNPGAASRPSQGSPPVPLRDLICCGIPATVDPLLSQDPLGYIPVSPVALGPDHVAAILLIAGSSGGPTASPQRYTTHRLSAVVRSGSTYYLSAAPAPRARAASPFATDAKARNGCGELGNANAVGARDRDRPEPHGHHGLAALHPRGCSPYWTRQRHRNVQSRTGIPDRHIAKRSSDSLVDASSTANRGIPLQRGWILYPH